MVFDGPGLLNNIRVISVFMTEGRAAKERRGPLLSYAGI